MRYVAVYVAIVASLCLVSPAFAAEYGARKFTAPDGKTLPYRLLKPDDYDQSKHYPLLLLLHGFGDRGEDNEKPIKAETNGAGIFLKSSVREKYPAFVVVPQTPNVWVAEPDFKVTTPFREKPQDSIRLTSLIVLALMKEFSIDADRFYVMGYSNGGCGVWDILCRAPKTVAAAVIKSGAGDPAHIAGAKSVPVWVFHGAKDPTVPVARAQEMVEALKKAGGHVFYNEYPSAGHPETAIKAHHEPELLPWMFAQRRGKPVIEPESLKTKSPSNDETKKKK